MEILAGKAQNMGSIGPSDGGSDEELVEQAIAIIAQTRKASATLLQRKLNV
jgi:DNA segregation ATPase FtsK/SpoIIIE-like protein